jgi:hypothetical protein
MPVSRCYRRAAGKVDEQEEKEEVEVEEKEEVETRDHREIRKR